VNMKKIFLIPLNLLLLPLAASAAGVSELAREQLEQAYPGARIAVAIGEVSCPGGEAPRNAAKATLALDSGRGYARFALQGAGIQAQSVTECWVRFSALMPAWVAKRRILPGEKLSQDSFERKEIDVAQGMAREMRGLLLTTDLTQVALESRQTILEGQPALSNAVQQTPDIRRGDALRIRMLSGGVILSTAGTAEEPAYLQSPVRVITQKSKRQLVGKLVESGVVEVRL
jgi:flagella basal body P-ring formation protein FlgA